MKDKINLVQYEDLTPDLQLIADAFDMNIVHSMLRELSGMYLYIPNLSRLESFVLRYLQENIDRPVKQVALELGVSAQYLWKLKREKLNKKIQYEKRQKK
jgi:hypothetical protein